jgi:hypothetical protein
VTWETSKSLAYVQGIYGDNLSPSLVNQQVLYIGRVML